MVFTDFNKDINLIFERGVHINPIEMQEQNISAINKIGRIWGTTLRVCEISQVCDDGRRIAIRVRLIDSNFLLPVDSFAQPPLHTTLRLLRSLVEHLLLFHNASLSKIAI